MIMCDVLAKNTIYALCDTQLSNVFRVAIELKQVRAKWWEVIYTDILRVKLNVLWISGLRYL